MYEIIDLEELADRYHDRLAKICITDTLKHINVTKWEDLSICDRQKLVNWVYSVEKNVSLSLGRICNSAFEHRKQILTDKCNKVQFYEILVKRWKN